MELYIKGAGILSAAGSNSNDDFLNNAPTYETDRLSCLEPDYTGIIPPMQLRRMSKVIRMGIAASKICMADAGVDKPDALSIGTAMGCLHDTEIFLSKMVDQEEQMLTPTAFIQSTHNTVGGQIALLAGCYGHNLTYVHRGHSFEHALVNTQLYLDGHKGEQVLAGGIDELTDTSFAVLQQANVYRRGTATPETLLAETDNGSIGGEGASFFMITDKKEANSKLCIKDISLFTTKDNGEAEQKINDFLNRNELTVENIGLVLLGVNGDMRSKYLYNRLSTGIFKYNALAAFKHLSGEYATSSAFALGLLYHAVSTGVVPQFMMLNDKEPSLKKMLIINNYMHYYSCWYLEGL